VLSFFWGDLTRYVDRAHAAGAKVFHLVGSVTDAIAAARVGVDVIVAQGVEAGGHVAGELSTLVLVPRVVDAIAPTPVVASGGISDGRGLVAALALGAQAAMMGTRFLATREARAHPLYKQKLLESTERRALLAQYCSVTDGLTRRTGHCEQNLLNDGSEMKRALRNHDRTSQQSVARRSVARTCRCCVSWAFRPTWTPAAKSNR
jgi:NAD(P)H-dependent flavin oxidoreductase YrpB (nitropropane dioxygenase family)